MIRFAWLQARTQTAVVTAGVAVAAIVAVFTGPHLGHLYATTVANCRSQQNCVGSIDPFSNNDYALYGALGMLVLILPAILGMFLGAPLLARELESGTYRLAWTQSVGRRRWLGVKIAVVGLASVAVCALLSLAVSWAARSIDLEKTNQFRYFDQRDLVPIGYAAFAFILGVVVGLIVRRVLPALAVTLVSFVAVRFVVERWVRAHLVAATHSAFSLQQARLGFTVGPAGGGVTFQADAPNIQNAFVLSAHIVDRTGHPVSAAALHQFVALNCPTIAQAPLSPTAAHAGRALQGPADPAAFNTCIDRLSTVYHQSVAYIAPTKYWPMQWLEMGLFIAAALLLVGVAVWLVKRIPS